MQEQEAKNHILPGHYENISARFAHILNLLDNEQNAQAKSLLLELHYADFADLLDNTGNKTHKQIIEILGDAFPADALVWLGETAKQSIEEIIEAPDLAKLIDQLDTEDAIETIEGFTDSTREEVVKYLSIEKSRYIIEGLTYPEHSAGRIMEKQFIALPSHWTVGQAIDYIRRLNISHEFYAAIVVDAKYKPIGNVLLCTLLQNSRSTNIKDIMNDDFKIADTSTSLDHLSYIFKQYALTVVPITNHSGKLVGTVSINNMLYIVEEQMEEDAMHLGGVSAKDTFYSLIETITHRFPWLFINLVTACITSMIVNQFTDTIAQVIALASIMPIVASMGGTAGTQVMTVTVMSLSDKDITKSNIKKIIIKELLVCIFNGLVLAFIAGITMLVIFSYPALSAVLGAAIMMNFIFAGLLGSCIPIMLSQFNMDPAVVSAVFLNALIDALGFLTFLTLAYKFLIP